MWRPSGPTFPRNVSAVGIATSISGKSSFQPGAHQSRSNGPVSPITDPSIRVTPAAPIWSASPSSGAGPSSGSPCPTSHRSPSITPSTGAAWAIARVWITRSGPTVASSAMDSSSFSFEAGARSTHARCRYQKAPSSPIVTDIRRVADQRVDPTLPHRLVRRDDPGERQCRDRARRRLDPRPGRPRRTRRRAGWRGTTWRACSNDGTRSSGRGARSARERRALGRRY